MARLIVIDDDPALCDTLADLLRDEGYEVRTAEDGSTGLSLINEWPPDLVVCDLKMPGMSGYDVLQKLRSTPATAALPLIILTAVAHDEARRQGMELGADDYLDKPTTRTELVRAIRARLSRRKQVQSQLAGRLEELRAKISTALPHVFLTPLTTVLGLSQFLVDECATLPSEMILESARSILEAGQQLRGFILKLSLYTELETALHDSTFREVNRKRKTTQAERNVRNTAAQAAFDRERSDDLLCATDESSLSMSAEHLEGLVRELVENALAHSKAGSPVSVSLKNVNAARCILEVSDRGAGMNAEQVERLGAPFSAGQKSISRMTTELGWAIVNRIVGLYSGQVDVESAPGRGTTIRVSLPRAVNEDRS